MAKKYPEFGAWFTDAVKRAGLSDEGFALKARGLGYKCSRSAPRWWKDGTQPGPQNCELIARVLEVDPATVLRLAGHSSLGGRSGEEMSWEAQELVRIFKRLGEAGDLRAQRQLLQVARGYERSLDEEDSAA